MMRLAASALILLVSVVSAFAVSPEDDYWSVRQRAIKRLQFQGHEKPDDQAYRDFENAALADLGRRVIAIVGLVKVEGFSNKPWVHVNALSDSPDYGLLDGVEFPAAGHRGGSLVVTTKTLLEKWLADRPNQRHPPLAKAIGPAVRANEFYGDALDPEDGFEGVADIPVPKTRDGSLVVAKLGRFGQHTDSLQTPVLIVTVVTKRLVLIVSKFPATRVPEIAACTARAASFADASLLPDAWGPLGFGPAFEAWRNCERQRLPAEPRFAQLKREAREISERLARVQ